MPTEGSPATKREILDALPRRALLNILDRFELDVADRRKRAEILERLASSRKANVPDILDTLSRDQLKEVCRHLGLDDRGKEKAVLIGRIQGTEPSQQQGLGLDRKRPTPEVRPDGTLTDEDAPVDELQPPPPEKLTVEALERYLWSAADILRGSIDSSDYKSYIFGLLFLKRLSDVFEEEAEKLIAEGEPERIAWEEPTEHQFFVPPQARWSKLQKTATNIGEALNKACSAVEEANSWALEGVLAGVDFNDERRLGDGKNRDSVLSRLVQHFSKVSLRNAHLSEPDMLRRPYEYLIRFFSQRYPQRHLGIGRDALGRFHAPRNQSSWSCWRGLRLRRSSRPSAHLWRSRKRLSGTLAWRHLDLPAMTITKRATYLSPPVTPVCSFEGQGMPLSRLLSSPVCPRGRPPDILCPQDILGSSARVWRCSRVHPLGQDVPTEATTNGK